MHVEPYGTGDRPYLAVHGWAGNHRTFRPLVPYLPDEAALYCVDLPGYGLSPKPIAWKLDAMADALADTICTVSREPLSVIGYCGGGNLAMMAAKRVPDRVARLVLIDPFAYMPLYFKVFTWGEFGRRAYFSTFANPVGRHFTNAALWSKRSRQTSLTKSFEKVEHDFVLDVLRAFCRAPHWETFRDLTMPIDLVYGDRSFAAVKRSVAVWKSVWPQAREHALAGTGHSPLMEATVQVASVAFGPDMPSGICPVESQIADAIRRHALTH